MKEIDVSNLSQDDRDRLLEAEVEPPVYHIGKQWAVTGYGIEQIRGSDNKAPYYHIPACDLGQGMGEGGWPAHMANKNWVDADDFSAAFEIAKKIHP